MPSFFRFKMIVYLAQPNSTANWEELFEVIRSLLSIVLVQTIFFDGARNEAIPHRIRLARTEEAETPNSTANAESDNVPSLAMASSVQAADWVSLTIERVEHVKATGRIADVSEIRSGSVAATAVSDGLERDLWLFPIEGRRKQGALREGMREGFTLGQYLMLVDYTSRLVRDGKPDEWTH